MTQHSQSTAKVISIICGWLYVISWSLSFYPQPILNYRRKSVEGLTPDFPTLNLIGFGSYTASTFLFLCSSTIRAQYAARHPRSPEPTVRYNDLAFGAHAFVLCCITYSQFWPRLWGWKMATVSRKCTKVTYTVMAVCFAVVFVTSTIVLVSSLGRGHGKTPDDWALIDIVYSLTYVKLILTVFKYIPQATANYRHKSTLGWSVGQVLFDFAGGILSLTQLFIDSALQADWSGLTGNPVKFGLANISMVFDLIFMTQHFILYGPVRRKDEEHTIDGESARPDERDALLPQNR